jgi:hypothetical protein
MQNHVMSLSGGATRKGVEAMIRQCPDEFLQNHIFKRVLPEDNKFVNGVDVSENFDAIRNSAVNILFHLCVTDEGVVDKEAIQKELACFNPESQRAEEYVAPPNYALHEGYKRTLHDKFTCIFKEMKITG